jgi:hypothetical protein
MSRPRQFLFNARCCALDLVHRNWCKFHFHFRGLCRAIA